MNLLPNPSPLEASLESVQRILDLQEQPIRELYNAFITVTPRLSSLASDVSMDFWEESWPEDFKRRLLDGSLRRHMRKGTPGAIHHALALFGCRVSLIEWWQTSPKGNPFTFSVNVNAALYGAGHGPVLNSDTMKRIDDVIRVTKPKSRLYDIQVRSPARSQPGICAIGRVYTRITGTVVIRRINTNTASINILCVGRAYTRIQGSVKL